MKDKIKRILEGENPRDVLAEAVDLDSLVNNVNEAAGELVRALINQVVAPVFEKNGWVASFGMGSVSIENEKGLNKVVDSDHEDLNAMTLELYKYLSPAGLDSESGVLWDVFSQAAPGGDDSKYSVEKGFHS